MLRPIKSTHAWGGNTLVRQASRFFFFSIALFPPNMVSILAVLYHHNGLQRIRPWPTKWYITLSHEDTDKQWQHLQQADPTPTGYDRNR
ncbi:hypothetical protein BJX76DRAFT_243789 [Aspergillus varians]